MMNKSLVFVYNANSGMFNSFADIAHKAFSPGTYKCSLCKITHDLFHEKNEWKDFIGGLGVGCELLHIDEFKQKHGNEMQTFPALFRIENGGPVLVADDAEIDSCAGLEDLKQLVRAVL